MYLALAMGRPLESGIARTFDSVGMNLLVLVAIGGEKDELHAVICKTRSESGTGLDFITTGTGEELFESCS